MNKVIKEEDNLIQLEQRFQEVFGKAFPNIVLSPFRYGSNERLDYTEFLIPYQNVNLKGSNYYIDNKLDFYHFTNINALQSIISSKTIRLYNFNNLNDPREYLFAGNLIPQNKEYIDDALDNSFILSLSQDISEMKMSEKFNMWRLYGDNGFGCIIKISFVLTKPADWHNFHLSKVYYGTDNRRRIKHIGQLLTRINSKTNQLGIDMGQLLCFHKSFLYKSEKEIRLLYDKREKREISYAKHYDSKNKLEFPIIRAEIKNSFNPKVRYLELPIVDTEGLPIDNHIPFMKIGHIILGYRLRNQFSDIRTEIKNLFQQKLGFIPLITQSKLTKVFWGKDNI